MFSKRVIRSVSSRCINDPFLFFQVAHGTNFRRLCKKKEFLSKNSMVRHTKIVSVIVMKKLKKGADHLDIALIGKMEGVSCMTKIFMEQRP